MPFLLRTNTTSSSQVRSLSVRFSVEYAWLHSVYGLGSLAPNIKTVRDLKLSNQRENHLWKIEKRKEEKRNIFAPSVLLSLHAFHVIHLKHTRFPSTYIVSLPFYHFLRQITHTFFAFMVQMMRSKHKRSSHSRAYDIDTNIWNELNTITSISLGPSLLLTISFASFCFYLHLMCTYQKGKWKHRNQSTRDIQTATSWLQRFDAMRAKIHFWIEF